MPGEVEAEFEAAMRQLHAEASRLGYNATYFIRLVEERGGVSAARKLVNDGAPADGFVKLWEMKRLDLSVEAAVAERPEFASLFTPAERLRARQRLAEYGRGVDG